MLVLILFTINIALYMNAKNKDSGNASHWYSKFLAFSPTMIPMKLYNSSLDKNRCVLLTPKFF